MLIVEVDELSVLTICPNWSTSAKYIVGTNPPLCWFEIEVLVELDTESKCLLLIFINC